MFTVRLLADGRIVGTSSLGDTDLLNERTRVVEDIGRVKRLAQLPIYEPKREDQVYANIAEANSGPITQDAVRRIFERIIDEMRGIQRERMRNDGVK